MLICPTRLPGATLYVLTSESNQKAISFHDVRSGKDFSGQLENGRAALLLISDEGKLITSYNWPANESLSGATCSSSAASHFPMETPPYNLSSRAQPRDLQCAFPHTPMSGAPPYCGATAVG